MKRNLLAALVCLLTGCRDGKNPAPATDVGKPQSDEWIEKLVWLSPADLENPFGREVLDCRSLALGFTAMTGDRSVAESFNRLRLDDGKACIGTLPENTFTVNCDLRFPYNGNRDNGVLFAAKEMEDKWDFYAYDSRLYIRRSWTGVLLHVAELRYTNSEVIIEKIHSDRDTVHGDVEFAKSHIKFLILTHFGRTRMPFPIPPGTPRSEKKNIALVGFNTYGSRAQFASYMNHREDEQSGAGNGGGAPARTQPSGPAAPGL